MKSGGTAVARRWMNNGTFHRMRGANNSPHVCLCARTCDDMYDRAAVRDDGSGVCVHRWVSFQLQISWFDSNRSRGVDGAVSDILFIFQYSLRPENDSHSEQCSKCCQFQEAKLTLLLMRRHCARLLPTAEAWDNTRAISEVSSLINQKLCLQKCN